MSWAAWGAGEATRALLAFPLASASVMFADVLRNWILDSWEGKDRDNRITALPGLSTHTRHTESHSRKVSSGRSWLRAAAEPPSPRVTPPGTREWPPSEAAVASAGILQDFWLLSVPPLPTSTPRKQLQHTYNGRGWGDARVHHPHPLRTADLAWLGSVAPKKASLPTRPSPSEITWRV